MTPRNDLPLYEDLPVLRRVRAPWLVRALSTTLLVLLVCIVVGLAAVPWQQSVRGQGRVVAYAPLDRQQVVEAPVDGRVIRFAVREGSRLKAGDVIGEISDIDPMFLERLGQERAAVAARKDAAGERVASVEERIRSLESSRAMALDAARARVDMANERLRAARQATTQADASLAAAEANLPRIRALADKGIRSLRDKELAEMEQTRAKAELERAKAAETAAEKEVASLVADRERIGNDATASINDARASLGSARADLAAARAELARMDVRVSRQQNQVVVAPRAGTVLRLSAFTDGQIVKQGDPLVVLVPDDSERAAELWVDGNDTPLIAAGRKVRLQFEGWPALQFVGWPSVAVGTFGGQVALVDSADDGQGKFRIVVVPDPEQPNWPSNAFLRQGVRANGWVLLDRVAIGFELWRQLNGFPPTVMPPAELAGQGDRSTSGTREKK